MPGEMYGYLVADLIAAALWSKYLADDPLDPQPGLNLRRLLFESSAQQPWQVNTGKALGSGEREGELCQERGM